MDVFNSKLRYVCYVRDFCLHFNFSIEDMYCAFELKLRLRYFKVGFLLLLIFKNEAKQS